MTIPISREETFFDISSYDVDLNPHSSSILPWRIVDLLKLGNVLSDHRNLFIRSIQALSRSVELRDEYTGRHTARVTRCAVLIAEAMRLPLSECEISMLGTPLHDIGKIGVDDTILRKPGRLTSKEMKIMQCHTIWGEQLLASIPELECILPIVRSHHERWDGNGYPDGLAGKMTPRFVRAVCVADSFDAMTSNRPYRKGMAVSDAVKEIIIGRGSQFDPDCVDAFMKVIEHNAI